MFPELYSMWNCWVNTQIFGQIDDTFTIKHRDQWLAPISEKDAVFTQ